MKLAISQIAWHQEEEVEILPQLKAKGVSYIELVPSRIFKNVEKQTKKELLNCKQFWEEQEITPVAFQSLLYKRPDLTLFESKEALKETEQYLSKVITVAGELDISSIVFGAPKNRIVPIDMSQSQAWDISISLFNRLGKLASDCGTCFCVEPNPIEYGCNFITQSTEGLEIVRAVGSEGFGLHLDLAAMWLAEEDIESTIRIAAKELRHFHMSAPNLEEVCENGLPNQQAINALAEIGYDSTVSIEMRSTLTINSERVLNSIKYVENCIQNTAKSLEV